MHVTDPFGTGDPESRAQGWWWGATATGFVVALAYAFAGLGGVLIVLVVGAAAVGVAVPLRLPKARRPRHRQRPSVPMADAAFPDYRRIVDALSWASVSPRHYDVATRPLLQRLLAGRLAERHGIDLQTHPERARDMVGADIWPLLDPRRPARDTSAPPGVDMAVVAQIVERLERL